MLPKVFHHVLLEFVPLAHLPFHFSTALQTLELFLTFAFSLAFYDISDKFTVFTSIFLSVLLTKAAIVLSSFFFHSLVLVVGKKMPSL